MSWKSARWSSTPPRTVSPAAAIWSRITVREYALVEFLALRRGEVVTRTVLYEHLFDEEDNTFSNLLDVHVSNLRKKRRRIDHHPPGPRLLHRMKFFHSIRWRLQLWHGLLLAFVLAGFGFTAWQLQCATQFQRIDQELERRVSVIATAVRLGGQPPRAGFPPPGRDRFRPPPDDDFGPPFRDDFLPPRDGFPRPKPAKTEPDGKVTTMPGPRALFLLAHDSRLFAGDSDNAFYHVVWSHNGPETFRSATAPSDEGRPERVAGAPGSRWRGTLREFFHSRRRGDVFWWGGISTPR